MLKKFEGFTIWSEDYKSLANWYKEKFNLKQVLEVDIPEDKAIAFEIDPSNDMYLWIGYHSEVKGKTKEPYRLMISYFVDDVDKIYETLKERGVEFIAEPHDSPTGDLRVLTAKDLDGNIIQMFSKL
ncbi:MAG: VOC family protein [Candidatus Dojkabacteria bacterium]